MGVCMCARQRGKITLPFRLAIWPRTVLNRAVAQPLRDNQYTCELDVPAFCCAV